MTSAPADYPTNLGNLLGYSGTGDRLAFVDLRIEEQPVELTACELDNRVRSFACGLKNAGVNRGDKIGFLSANRWEMLAGYLGAMYMGAIAVPINYKFPRETIVHIVDDADISMMFFDDDRAPLVPEDVRRIGFDDSVEFGEFLDVRLIDAFEPEPGGIAEILYTSGSTGMPKGVPLTHAGQLWALSKYVDAAGNTEEPGSSLIVAPLFHMNALVFSCVCLLSGVTIISQPGFDAARYINAVARYRCTQLSGVPTMLAMVAALDPHQRPNDLSCVKTISIGSAPLSEALLSQIHALFPEAVVSNGYGTTEIGPAVFGPHPEGKPPPPLSIGYPHADIEWRLTGGTDDEGVLEVRTPALTPGYLNRPDADAERFIDGWFNTNDIMRHDENGFFHFVSRADDMFVCGGENIYPAEVEKLLNKHPAVQQSLVVGAPDDIKGMVPVAFVVPMRKAGIDEAELKAFMIDSGPAYAHPRRIAFRNSLPVGGTQKIERKSLENEAAEMMISMRAGKTGRIR